MVNKSLRKRTKDDVAMIIDATYEEIVFWRRNLFLLPTGAAGKKYVVELTKWIEYWNNESEFYRDITMKVVMVMSPLLLQKPSYRSTSKEHSQCLARRMMLWKVGDFDSIMCEARTIQEMLQTNVKQHTQEHSVKTFAKLMFEGKVNAEMKLLDKQNGGGVLPLTKETVTAWREKHRQPADMGGQCTTPWLSTIH